MADFDYVKEELWAKKKLASKKYDIEVMENTGKNYEDKMDESFVAFEKYLDSDDFKSLGDRIFGK